MGLSTGSKGGNTRKKVGKTGAKRPVKGTAASGVGGGRGAGSRAQKGLTLNGITSTAVEKATGKGWAEWVTLLDRDGAAKMSHKEIAGHLHAKRGVGDWWCQMVTVGYEQAKGRRERHQKPDGFEVSVNKTLAVPVASVVAAFEDPKVRAKWLPKEKFEIRGVTPGKAVRITWGDGTNVVVGFYGSTVAKARVSVQHGKLKSAAEAEQRKGFWRARLAALAEAV